MIDLSLFGTTGRARLPLLNGLPVSLRTHVARDALEIVQLLDVACGPIGRHHPLLQRLVCFLATWMLAQILEGLHKVAGVGACSALEPFPTHLRARRTRAAASVRWLIFRPR